MFSPTWLPRTELFHINIRKKDCNYPNKYFSESYKAKCSLSSFDARLELKYRMQTLDIFICNVRIGGHIFASILITIRKARKHFQSFIDSEHKIFIFPTDLFPYLYLKFRVINTGCKLLGTEWDAIMKDIIYTQTYFYFQSFFWEWGSIR